MISNSSSPETSPGSEQVKVPQTPISDLKAPIPSCFVGFGGEPKQRHEGKPSTGYRSTEDSENHQSTYPDQNDNGIPTRD